MSDEIQKIICPGCGLAIDLDEIIQKRLSRSMQEQESDIRKRLEAEFQKEREAEEKRLLDEKKALHERAKEWAEKEAIKRVEETSAEYKIRLEAMEKSAEENRKKELEFFKTKQALEDQIKNQELDTIRKIDEERKKIEEKEKLFLEERIAKEREEYERKIAEQAKQMDLLKARIDEAKRTSEQGSQQIQGEIQESELKRILTETFPHDRIEDVPTGKRGADLVQYVCNRDGRQVGIILWESKNTKHWGGDWIKKLKDDRMEMKADICIIISNILPEGIQRFGLSEDVWISEFMYTREVAFMLRERMFALDRMSRSVASKDEKMETLYQYLSGEEFASKMRSILDTFVTMRDELEREKTIFQRVWQRREKEIERLMKHGNMLYGDIEGILGRRLEIEDMLLLDGGENDI